MTQNSCGILIPCFPERVLRKEGGKNSWLDLGDDTKKRLVGEKKWAKKKKRRGEARRCFKWA